MATQDTTPNQYEVSGHGTHVTYSTTSTAGQPQLHYKDGVRDRTFTGNEIQAMDSPIGLVVTVTIQPSVDSDFTTFTMLLPHINLAAAESHFVALGIVTAHHFLAPNPSLIQGPRESYHSFTLHGKASLQHF